jgi:hypothetical protein
MDGDRKYKQPGYQDRREGEHHAPRSPVDGPPTPRLVRSVAASRCFNCSNVLSAGFDFAEPCPKCGVALHCCSQCTHMDSSARFQCLQPIPERIPYKDRANECPQFSPRITVARDTAAPVAAKSAAVPLVAPPNVPRKVQDARTAFDNLFKKTSE